MKPIVDYVKECEAKSKPVALSSDVAMSSGFTMAGKKSKAVEKGYIVIKERRIFDYLREVVKESLKEGEKVDHFDEREHETPQAISVQAYLVEKPFAMFRSYHRWYTDRFAFVETPVEEYAEIPPAFVYNKLLKAKEDVVFDYYTVATIQNIKDPLLLGRINNDTNRYFIAQWDDDIQLDNLI